MRVELEPGYVLHRRDYRDTSLLLDIWTQQYGRVSLVARGARGPRARFSALQPFQRILFSWSQRGELGTLSAAEPQGGFFSLSGRFAISGFYLNELLVSLLHKHDPHCVLFDLYENALRELSSLHDGDFNDDEERRCLFQESVTLRRFERRLLEELGYGIDLSAEGETGVPISPEGHYEFNVEQGFHLARSGAKDVFLGQSLLLYAQESFDAQTLKDAKRLMRIAFHYHLDGKALKSRELRAAMEREKHYLDVKEK